MVMARAAQPVPEWPQPVMTNRSIAPAQACARAWGRAGRGPAPSRAHVRGRAPPRALHARARRSFPSLLSLLIQVLDELVEHSTRGPQELTQGIEGIIQSDRPIVDGPGNQGEGLQE